MGAAGLGDIWEPGGLLATGHVRTTRYRSWSRGHRGRAQLRWVGGLALRADTTGARSARGDRDLHARALAFGSAVERTRAGWWMGIDVVTGSLLLGSTFAAMLLGHWYLNSPTMKLDPLRWLLILMAMSIVARACVSGLGFGVHFGQSGIENGFTWAAITMRWLAGILGLGGMTWMTWQTLKIPNTQSATGHPIRSARFCFSRRTGFLDRQLRFCSAVLSQRS